MLPPSPSLFVSYTDEQSSIAIYDQCVRLLVISGHLLSWWKLDTWAMNTFQIDFISGVYCRCCPYCLLYLCHIQMNNPLLSMVNMSEYLGHLLFGGSWIVTRAMNTFQIDFISGVYCRCCPYLSPPLFMSYSDEQSSTALYGQCVRILRSSLVVVEVGYKSDEYISNWFY